MEKAPRYIDSNSCDNDWNKMVVNESGYKRFCSSCSQFVHDLTQKDVFELSQKDLEGKCISLHEHQFQDLMFIHPLKRFAAAIFIVFGSSLFTIPETFSQDIEKHEASEQFIQVMGVIADSKGKPIVKSHVTITFYDEFILDVITDENGVFEFKVNNQIYNNIKVSKDNKSATIYIGNKAVNNSYNLGEISLTKKKKYRRRRRLRFRRKRTVGMMGSFY